MKNIHIFGGGTFSHVRNHLSLSAPAFGTTASLLANFLVEELMMDETTELYEKYSVDTHLTKMADRSSNLVSSEDVEAVIDQLIEDRNTRCIIMNAAFVDFNGVINDEPSSKHADRLHTREGQKTIALTPAKKIISKIRQKRKDIFVVGFKTTTNASIQQQYAAGLKLLKESSINLVLCNDVVTRRSFIVVPEEAKYTSEKGFDPLEALNRHEVLRMLCKMTVARMENSTFTRSEVVDGDVVDWNSDLIHPSLRTVVNYCIDKGAYKPFHNKTVGHFAYRNGDRMFTSIRKSNFNELETTGLVEIVPTGEHDVVALGAKPSVGGQSQRQIFADHPEYDCIVHFHCPPKRDSKVTTRPQWMNECGSHQCGQNTSRGLELVDDGIKAVFLEEHGPNIVFKHDVPPERVIDFIEKNFELTGKTGGIIGNGITNS